MAKFQDIRALAKQQLQAVTKNGECWKAFLHTAAIAYNYNFPNQLLIYCQNPTATAVADMEYWNKEAGRQVKRGAHGIPILDVKKEMMALRYLFDISDTIPQARTDKGLPWAVTDQNWKPVWDKIIRDNQADSIQNALLMLSTSYVAQRRGMFLQALAQSVDGSSLQWAKPEDQQHLFLQLITQSCLYMAALRCGVDTQRLDLSAFDSVGQFDTKALAFCLGSACQRASKPLMHQIGSIAREIDSVARKEKVRYYGGEQAITNQNKEADHGVQNGERVRDPEPDAGRNAEAGDRQVRQYAQEISGRESTDPVRDDADGGNAVPASGRDQQRSEPADRADRAAADAADRSARPENGPAGLDAVDERTESPSRGTGDEANLQPVTEPPLEESVQTPSSFSIPIPDLPPLDDSLILGLLAQQTSTRADNADILAYFEKHPGLASRSEFCRTSYKQIYTQLYVGERMAGFIRHDQYLELWEGNYLTKSAQSNLTWDSVSDKIAALIEQGQLLVPIRTTALKPELEQLTLTPEQSDAVGLSDSQKQQEVIEETAKRKNWKSPTIDASGKYVTEQDITDVLAKLAAQNNPAFAVNVQALETVQPKDLEASEIAVRLGATWLAPELIKQFADELVDAPYYVRDRVKVLYIPLTGVWNVTNKSFTGGNIKATVTYGTQRANFYHILEESLNLRDVRIFDTKEDMQGNKIRVLNAAATQEAQMKQQQIEDAFKDWIWKDATRRQMLVKEYNERFNSLRPREYDGSHILFHGMSPEITLRPHQKNAIAHILYGGNTLLAHVVGTGKTYEMVAAAMEKKRLGLCSKTLICVPNHLTEQMAAEALLLYPNAEILVARKTDFEKANRKKFCARIATGNFDIIVIGHSQFERIPLSQERQVEYLQSQIHDVINQVAQLKEERAENFTVKQMERMRKQLEKKLDKLNDQSRKDDVVTFEQLGVDSLMVDEAHAFKNLAVLSKMRNVAGISQTESQRASDLYMKCRYLDEITGSRGVVFATGTPISNSMAELFTMQRYLQRETLEQHGLSSFDAWASTFGETVTAVELAPEGTSYRTKTRFSKFYNLPELMSMFKQVADVQTADMLNLPVPKLVGGKPINVALPPSHQQKQMVADLADRAEEIRAGNVDPTEDNMLKVTNDGRKLALDQRLIDPDLPENPNDKIHACAENVYRIWSETKDKRLTQLVFCDLSTPKPDGFNVYDDLRNLLISMGIPENEVQFIHSANTEAKKAELFAKVRSGDVRVLMGSTGKMGAGTNVQRLLVATHHLDCGWKPSDIEQRNGRMIRQGNTNAEVYEYRYVTEASFDSYMWQLLETKQKFIGQIVTSKSPARSADDLDDAALSYAEVKALAAGNPMIKEKMDLDIQVARLKTLKTAYNNEHYRLEDAITQGFPAEMRKTAQQLENAKADTALLQQNTKRDADGKDVFAIALMDTVYTKREDAGKALLGLLGMAMNRTEPVSIGRYKGFDLQIAYFAMDKMYLAYLVGSGINPVQLGADAVGNTVRLDNCLHNLPQSVTDLESKLVQLQKQLENAKEQLAQPFAQANELAEKSKRLAELEALLNLNEKDIVLDTVPDEEQQCRSDNRQRGQER